MLFYELLVVENMFFLIVVDSVSVLFGFGFLLMSLVIMLFKVLVLYCSWVCWVIWYSVCDIVVLLLCVWVLFSCISYGRVLLGVIVFSFFRLRVVY